MHASQLWTIAPQPDPASVISGNGYRITVLTDRLLRLEYEPDGLFLEDATQAVLCRRFPVRFYPSGYALKNYFFVPPKKLQFPAVLFVLYRQLRSEFKAFRRLGERTDYRLRVFQIIHRSIAVARLVHSSEGRINFPYNPVSIIPSRLIRLPKTRFPEKASI